MSATTRYELDVAALAAAIATVSRHRKITSKEVAAETGLSASTLTRLSQGHKPDADALVTLLAWLNASADGFTRERGFTIPAGDIGGHPAYFRDLREVSA